MKNVLKKFVIGVSVFTISNGGLLLQAHANNEACTIKIEESERDVPAMVELRIRLTASFLQKGFQVLGENSNRLPDFVLRSNMQENWEGPSNCYLSIRSEITNNTYEQIFVSNIYEKSVKCIGGPNYNSRNRRYHRRYNRAFEHLSNQVLNNVPDCATLRAQLNNG